MKRVLVSMVIGLLTGVATAQTATTFTYQGALNHSGAPANGSYNFVFRLWNAAVGGSQVGPTVTLNNHPVSDGLVTAKLDFGAAAFDNSQRWLGITVNGVDLTPREAITRSPYSMQTRGIFVDSAMNVGVRTNSPQANLHIDGTGSTEVGLHVQSPGSSTGMIRFGSPRANVGISGNANNGLRRDIWFMDDGLGLFTRASSTESPFAGNGLFINDSGNVGIGTTSPATRLEVAGTGKFSNRLGVGNPTSLFGQLTIRDSGDGAPFAIETQWGSNSFPAIYALNTGSGGVLWALGSSDASLSGGGMIVIGNTSAVNMAIDNDEIMVRSNGNPSTLYLNAEGGDVRFGLHGTKPPHAYARITSAGAFTSRSSNVTNVSVTSTGFLVTIAGGVSASDIVIASDGSAGDEAKTMSADISGGQVRINCFGHVTGWGPHNVSFVIFRP